MTLGLNDVQPTLRRLGKRLGGTHNTSERDGEERERKRERDQSKSGKPYMALASSLQTEQTPFLFMMLASNYVRYVRVCVCVCVCTCDK